MLRKLLLIVLVPAAALLGWLALAPRAPRADFVTTSSEPRTIDPQRVSLLAELQLAAALFEGLTRLNAETFQPEPAVAQDWDISADGLTYTFHLRPAARWSNGDAVVAEDFRFAWLRALDPQSEAQYANLLFVIRGAEEYYRARLNGAAEPESDPPPTPSLGGRGATDVTPPPLRGRVGRGSEESVAIEALDDATLRVTLAGPCSYFLDLTSFPTFAPNHRPTLQCWAYRDGRVLRATQYLWTRPGHIVGNGAFVLTAWNFKESLMLGRNSQYWDRAAIGVETIEAYVTDNPNSALIAYETGRVDLVRGPERSVSQVLAAEQAAGRRQDFHTGDRFATFFYRVNCRRAPLDNPDLRKALSLAINRAALCEHILRLGETPAYTYVPRPTLPLMPRRAADGTTIYYEPPDGLGAALTPEQRGELAREYLRRSGFDRPEVQRPLEILFPPDPEQRVLAEAIQAMWERTLGIRVELRTLEGKVLSSRIRDLDYDLARSDWFGDYMDPSSFLDMFTAASGQNRTGWFSAEYDRLIAAAGREADNAARFGLFQQAERILCEDELPIIPVFFRRGNYLLSPRFEGINDNVRDLLQIHRVRLRTTPPRQ